MVAFRKLVRKLFGAGTPLQKTIAKKVSPDLAGEADHLTSSRRSKKLSKRRLHRSDKPAEDVTRRRLRRKLDTGMTFAAYKSNLLDRYTDLGVLTPAERNTLGENALMAIINEWLVTDPSAHCTRKMAEEMAMGCWVEDRLT